MPRHPWGLEHPRASRWEGEAAGAPTPAWGCGLLHRGSGHCWGARALSDGGRLGAIFIACLGAGPGGITIPRMWRAQVFRAAPQGQQDAGIRSTNVLMVRARALQCLLLLKRAPSPSVFQSRAGEKRQGGQLMPRDAQWVTPGHIKAIPGLGLGSSGTHRVLCSWLAPQWHTQHLPSSLSKLFLRIAWFLSDLVMLDNLAKQRFWGRKTLPLLPASSQLEKPRAAPALQPGLHLPRASVPFPWRFWEVTNRDWIWC